MGQSLRLMARSTDRDLLPRSLSLSIFQCFHLYVCFSGLGTVARTIMGLEAFKDYFDGLRELSRK